MNDTITIDGKAVKLYTPSPMPEIELPDLDMDDWRESATESHDNDMDALYSWDLGNGYMLHVWCEQGGPESAEISTNTHEQAAAEICDNLNDGSYRRSEWMQAMGFNGLDYEEEAEADWQGECAIWIEHDYYSGTCGAPQDGIDRDENNEIITYPTYAAAKEAVDEYYNAPSGYDGIRQCNVLSHGQAGADTLTIIKA